MCDFCGGLVFSLQYIIGKSCKYSLGIKFFEKELVAVKEEPKTQLEYESVPVLVDAEDVENYMKIDENIEENNDDNRKE